MKHQRRILWLHRLAFMTIGALAVLAALFLTAQAHAQVDSGPAPTPQPTPALPTPRAPAPPQQSGTVAAAEVTAVTRVLSYQGRLLDPATGIAKPDASYRMVFRLWNLPSGGTPANILWTEDRSAPNAVPVVKGSFSTLLGSVTPLPTAIFNGQDLWLGVSVGDDPEQTPRIRLGWNAYALYAERAASADTATNATSATNATNATNAANANNAANATNAANANLLDGYDSSQFYMKSSAVFTSGTLVGNGTGTWTTFAWPTDRPTVWMAVPTTNLGRVRLQVDTMLEQQYGITYWLTVTNLTSSQVSFDLRYSILN